MQQTRILLAVRPRMLCESLTEALQKRLGSRALVETLESWSDEIDLLVATREHRARVVILTVELEDRVPRSVARLLQEFPWLFVLALDLRSERARTFRYRIEVRSVEELSVSGLIHALRNVVSDIGGIPEN